MVPHGGQMDDYRRVSMGGKGGKSVYVVRIRQASMQQ